MKVGMINLVKFSSNLTSNNQVKSNNTYTNLKPLAHDTVSFGYTLYDPWEESLKKCRKIAHCLTGIPYGIHPA